MLACGYTDKAGKPEGAVWGKGAQAESEDCVHTTVDRLETGKTLTEYY